MRDERQIEPAPQPVDRIDAAAERKYERDDDIEQEVPAAQARTRKRVIGCFLVRGEIDLACEGIRNAVPMSTHGRALPQVEPYADGRSAQECDDEERGEPMHVEESSKERPGKDSRIHESGFELNVCWYDGQRTLA